jgi:hypothetical protein
VSKSTYPLKLPNSVKNAAAELAKVDGVSLNQFIAAAVAEKGGHIADRASISSGESGHRQAQGSSQVSAACAESDTAG